MGFNSHKKNKKNFWEHFHVPEHSINQNFPLPEYSGEGRIYCVSTIINDTAEWDWDSAVPCPGKKGRKCRRGPFHWPERLSDLPKVALQAGGKVKMETQGSCPCLPAQPPFHWPRPIVWVKKEVGTWEGGLPKPSYHPHISSTNGEHAGNCQASIFATSSNQS